MQYTNQSNNNNNNQALFLQKGMQCQMFKRPGPEVEQLGTPRDSWKSIKELKTLEPVEINRYYF